MPRRCGEGPRSGDGAAIAGGTFDAVYAFIVEGHRGRVGGDDRIPVEQLWQLTAYVRHLPTIDPNRVVVGPKRCRFD